MQGAATVVVQCDGPADEVMGTLQNVERRHPRHPRRRQRRRSPASKWTRRKGVDVRRELAAAVVSRGWGLLELRSMRMSLEDIFLSVITERTGGRTPPSTEEVVNA